MKTFLATGFGGLALLLIIVGLAIPYWMSSSSVHFGLWQFCDETQCVNINKIQDSSSDLNPARALELLGMLLLVGTMACAVLKLFFMKDQQMLPKVAGALAVVAGILMIIGCIVFAVKWTKKTSGFNLHAGFALCIVAAVSSFVSSALLFISKD